MIRSLTVTNPIGESLKMELAAPEKTGFNIRSIGGLGPTKASINTMEIAASDGSIYNSARLNERNITLDIAFYGVNIEELRHKTYRYFPIKQPIEILVETDRRIGLAYGYVESNEPDIFSPSEATQISIICPDPYFYARHEGAITETIFGGIDPMFEFPFSNESLKEKLLIFGDTKAMPYKSIFYEGDAETGVVITIHANSGVQDKINIFNSTMQIRMVIDPKKIESTVGKAFDAGDDIVITTYRGRKSIKLIKDGAEYNILNALDRDSQWITLQRGDNIIMYDAASSSNDIQMSVTNNILYDGL